MKKSVNVVKEQVMESLGSMFTKEDVIKVIDSIEINEPSTTSFDEEWYEEMENLIESIESDVDDISVDEDNVEFGLDGNRLYIESVDIDKSNIESLIRELKEKLQELKSVSIS
jgi:translation elongation factor EF-1beta